MTKSAHNNKRRRHQRRGTRVPDFDKYVHLCFAVIDLCRGDVSGLRTRDIFVCVQVVCSLFSRNSLTHAEREGGARERYTHTHTNTIIVRRGGRKALQSGRNGERTSYFFTPVSSRVYLMPRLAPVRNHAIFRCFYKLRDNV